MSKPKSSLSSLPYFVEGRDFSLTEVKKEITGQISGNVGAYGNFGGVLFLTLFSLTDAPTLFATMGIAALICASCCAFFLQEPKGSFASHYDAETEANVESSSVLLTSEDRSN